MIEKILENENLNMSFQCLEGRQGGAAREMGEEPEGHHPGSPEKKVFEEGGGNEVC